MKIQYYCARPIRFFVCLRLQGYRFRATMMMVCKVTKAAIPCKLVSEHAWADILRLEVFAYIRSRYFGLILQMHFQTLQREEIDDFADLTPA